MEKETRRYDFLNRGVISGFTDVEVAVVVPISDKTNFDIVQMEWGFIPNYLEDREAVVRMRTGYKGEDGKWVPGQPQLNAKSENLFISERSNRRSMFADATRNRRCLVLSTGFFEWQHIYRTKKNGEKLKKPDTYPYYISLPDNEYFYIAAIWNPWTDRVTGEMSNTVALVTAPANPLMKQVHNSRMRMPTILDDELAWRWIMEDLSDEEISQIAGTQHPHQKMTACSVTKDFLGRIDPTEPFAYPELPALNLSITEA
ncbi:MULTISPECIES: SOS response-associated peptidase [Mucilaginibacter]|uniref:SOS response-associated peptidase n=1 Tax=Mucilaginibacter TaxID=423349 RepID=UPI00142EE10E|nr:MULTISPECIES: SOS response-associated peptidase family protein [Mucilaginibacter]QTE41546.1 SOS response-associated peptidase family protein [Mucilaginibacter rubeus]QTE59543.1 SOS response-associated peptidase family protein [Mucilaginibacter rubeus]QTE60997.1 SOS response-associated peptidase family protein [Mucilaginibacter rubeus]QTF59758.1 SOS response-associated peptidase family protein [Mucilaginibacter rubeus]